MENDKEYYSKYKTLNYNKANSKTLVNAVEFDLWSEGETRPRQAVFKKVNFSTKSEKEVEFLKKCNIIEPNHTVKFYFAYSLLTKYYIFMEYCKRGSLSDVLREKSIKKEVWSQSDLLGYFIQLTSTLSKLHENEVYHRDIKPCNIFVTDNYDLKLGDLGDSKDVKEEINTIRGTRLYMSPKLLTFANDKNRSSIKVEFSPEKEEIWSLGKTFLEMAVVKHQLNFNDYNFLQIKDKAHELLEKTNFSLDFKRVIVLMLENTDTNVYCMKDFFNYFNCIAREEKLVLKDDVFINSSIEINERKSEIPKVVDFEEKKIMPDQRIKIQDVKNYNFTIKEASKESSTTFRVTDKDLYQNVVSEFKKNGVKNNTNPPGIRIFDQGKPE